MYMWQVHPTYHISESFRHVNQKSGICLFSDASNVNLCIRAFSALQNVDISTFIVPVLLDKTKILSRHYFSYIEPNAAHLRSILSSSALSLIACLSATLRSTLGLNLILSHNPVMGNKSYLLGQLRGSLTSIS